MSKWVYSFGAGHNEGKAEMRNLLGGKGANLAEMASIGLPVPPGFTITTEVCTYYYDHQKQYPPELRDQVGAALALIEKAVGAKFGDTPQAAAGLGPLRRPGLHAGDDGHRAQPRPERPDGGRPRRRLRRPALRLGQLPPLHPDVRQRRARRRPPPLRGDHRAREARPRRDRGHRPHRAGLAPRGRRLQGDGGRGHRRALPAGPRRAALGRDRRRLRVLDERPRQHLSPAARHPGRTGAPRSTSRRWSSATWARIARPASASPATRRPARTSSTANT